MTDEFSAASCRVQPVYADLTLPDTITNAAKYIGQETKTLDYIFHSSGVLHNQDESGKPVPGKPVLPEKAFRDVSMEGMLQTFTLNTFGPALVIKEFTPLLKKSLRNGYRMKELGKPPVFAALSAGAASLEGNKRGGWTSYRASKAALNMLLLNAHLEFSMGGQQKVIVLSLHPGTVDTPLSKPFHLAASKFYDIFTPDQAAQLLVDFCESAGAEHSGGFYDFNGDKIPW